MFRFEDFINRQYRLRNLFRYLQISKVILDVEHSDLEFQNCEVVLFGKKIIHVRLQLIDDFGMDRVQKFLVEHWKIQFELFEGAV